MEKFKSCPVLFSPCDEKYDEKKQLFQGCPTIAITKNGRIFVGWYAGGLKVGGTGQDDPDAVSVLTTADMATITANVIAALPNAMEVSF